ncbi:polysaccharide chain length determinant protein [Geotalea daltonii FRC-32]|uniref:Polysaccharide chain length determinant protein n=1 Tax=Geotalea daltonii (strain DSM 22248 / JCM 15807 / FRC-32) TaxID=316067 RepID=B9M2Z8_GEODF|nr:Wzz/FepE/Etk N-terminal domain-containing protein [Geotalea daltonii]ACM21344.1 polysaccharide chain length determinant protein [Geotalea daltonii FRC-32]
MDTNKDELQSEEEINLLDLLRVIVRRKKLIIKICVTAVVLSVAYSLTLPNIYTATARVLPPQKEGGGGISALLGQVGGLAGLAGGALGGSSDLYLGILKSRSVADAVIKKLDLQKKLECKSIDETRLALTSIVKTQAGKDGIITISADNKDAVLAATLANTMVAELGNRSVQLNLTRAGSERVFLEKRLDLVKDDLAKAENSLRDFQEKNKMLKVDSQAAATIEGIAQIRAEIVAKEVQLASLKSFQTDESPDVQLLKTSIAKLRNQMGSFSGNGAGDVIPAVGNVPNLGLEYARRLRELKTQEAIFEQLKKQYEVAKYNEAKDSSSVQVLDDAVVPAKKSKPKRSLIVLLSAVTAFFASIFIVFIQEYFDKMSDDDRGRWNEIKASLMFRRRQN